MDDGLFWQEVDKAIARQVVGVIADAGMAGPGGKLGENAGSAGIQNAIPNDLHVLVNVAVENTAQSVTSGQQCLMQFGAVDDQHVGIHPGGIHGQRGKVHK